MKMINKTLFVTVAMFASTVLPIFTHSSLAQAGVFHPHPTSKAKPGTPGAPYQMANFGSLQSTYFTGQLGSFGTVNIPKTTGYLWGAYADYKIGVVDKNGVLFTKGIPHEHFNNIYENPKFNNTNMTQIWAKAAALPDTDFTDPTNGYYGDENSSVFAMQQSVANPFPPANLTNADIWYIIHQNFTLKYNNSTLKIRYHLLTYTINKVGRQQQ